MTPKLLLLDGLNVLRRIYEVVPGEDSVEKAQGAVNSALGSVKRAIEECAPTHAVLAMDARGKNWRHEMFPEYKIHRSPMPEVLYGVLPDFAASLAERHGLPTLERGGFEADDIIASLHRAWRFSLPNAPVVILTTDKDCCALVDEQTIIRDHFGKTWRDAAWVETKFGVPPSKIQDFLALTGDSSDGIPGVSKIGAKTAAELLLRYETLEGVLVNAHHIKGKIGENLRSEADMALLSRALVGMKTDLQFGMSWKDCRCHLPPAEDEQPKQKPPRPR